MDNRSTYIPNIGGFVDFCSWIMDGKSFLWCSEHLQASFDCLTRIDCKYNFTDQNALAETEKAIRDNLYMFDMEETNKFFYPNDNMFSGNNAEKHITGYVATLKKQYRNI